MNVLWIKRTAAKQRCERYRAGASFAASCFWRMRARLDRIEHCNVTTACRRCASARVTRARARMEGQKKWDMRRTMMVLECGARMLLQLMLLTIALLCFLPAFQPSSPPPSLSSCDITW